MGGHSRRLRRAGGFGLQGEEDSLGPLQKYLCCCESNRTRVELGSQRSVLGDFIEVLRLATHSRLEPLGVSGCMFCAVVGWHPGILGQRVMAQRRILRGRAGLSLDEHSTDRLIFVYGDP